MQTAAAFCQVRERFSRRFFLAKNVQAFNGWFRFRGWRRDNSSKNRADLLHLLLQRAGEVFLGSKTKTLRETIERFAVFWNRMDLLFRFNLQPVLDAPEEAIGRFQIARFIARDQFQLRENWERFQGACFVQKGMPCSMQELECLNDKFDFTNPACAQLDVLPDVFIANDVPLDPSFDRGNLLKQIRRRTLRINERLMLAEKFVGELATAANPSCFDERKPFPGFAETSIVIFHALERAGERSGSPFRPKPEIDPKKCSGRTQSGKRFHDLGSEEVEPFMIAKIRRNLSFFAVKKNEVDVGTMIQLGATQLS